MNSYPSHSWRKGFCKIESAVTYFDLSHLEFDGCLAEHFVQLILSHILFSTFQNSQSPFTLKVCVMHDVSQFGGKNVQLSHSFNSSSPSPYRKCPQRRQTAVLFQTCDSAI